MQHLRQFCVVAALICALTYTTFAGDMEYPVVPPPPPPSSPSTIITEELQPIEGATSSETASLNIMEEIAWSLLQGALIVF